LPYQKGEKHVLVQGYNGLRSHNAETQSIYAVDFNMAEGTKICAAREGVVIAYKNDSNIGGADKVFEDCGNYVVIKHSDGSYATYNHLRFNGVLVRLGQTVAKGSVIALSGSTGWATGPHLHFAVFVPQDANHQVTYPIKFATAAGILGRLQEGELY
jgi:murein DD-endopeptidase MepM/ murein hydrolase activator NlpD